MSNSTIWTYSFEGLCRSLEWKHPNARYAVLRNENFVELLDEERETLDKIRELSKYGDRFVIKHILRNQQQWFEFYVDDIEVAYAYIDHQAFVGKSYWGLFSAYDKLR